MVRRIGAISPQKNLLRKSTRTSCQLNRSLDENVLADNIIKNSSLMNDLQRRANAILGSDGVHRIDKGSIKTRSLRRFIKSSSEDEDEIPTARSSRRTRRSSRTDHELHEDDDHDENMEQRSRTRRASTKRKRIVDSEDGESEQGRHNNSEDEERSLYDRVKRNRLADQKSPVASTSNGHAFSVSSSRSERSRRRASMASPSLDEVDINGLDEQDGHDKHVDEKEDEEDHQEDVDADDNNTEQYDEDEEEQGPRKYLLRKRNPNPTEFTYANNINISRAERVARREARYNNSLSNRDRHRRRIRDSRPSRRSDFKRRMCRSDSSSTGDEDDREAQRSRNEEHQFERRKEISMFKARNRFAPVNLTDKDLTTSQSVIRERMRQTGASCSDIDPMSLDKEVNFGQIGGLGAHIQSLKEVVLFPMLYPDVFSQFNLNPPKGVIFYGPPGTGKTLVARALANECSQGAKKVAFFMRKGADCLSKWVGESERQLRVLFDQAYAMRPSIIFFDEIDGLAPVRSSRQDQIHASIVSTLLALMDGLDNRGEVIVIGATNRLDTIDPALRRPGRFDRELKFSLPDAASRLQILNIHTAKWGENKPEDETLKWLSENTSGYCGADLKYLCTESVLISLRSRYPHIYMTSERLKLDLAEIKVEKQHLLDAMRRITPASRRDLSIPSRPLNERTSILLQSAVDTLLATRIPAGYRCSQSVQSTSSNELEKVVRALEPTPTEHAVRLLMCGSEHFADGGQTSYALPAVLSRLDHLPVYSLAVSRLFADGRPEEAFATTIQSALRSATTEPCILLLPSIDQWFTIVPPSVAHMLGTALDQLTGFTSILFLATCDVSYSECSEEIRQIFRGSNCLQMPMIPFKRRHKYFTHVVSQARIPPKEFDASMYIEPEKAQLSDIPSRRLSEKEAKELEKLYENQLREFRIFLRDQLGRLVRDRRFNIFAEPVDEEEAEDYYQVITNPMCLTDMMDKVDRREYTHPDQFLADINLIKNNAIEYNPPDNLYRKSIRHSAVALRDIVEEYFDKEFEEDFVEKLEETSRLLREAEIVPQNEKLLTLPDGYVRRTKWNATNAFRTSGRNKGNVTTSVTVTEAAQRPSSSMRRFRKSTAQSKQKQKTAAIVNSIRESISNGIVGDDDNNVRNGEIKSTEGVDEHQMDHCDETDPDAKASISGRQMNGNDTGDEMCTEGHASSVMVLSSPCTPIKKTLLIDDAQLSEVISAAVQRTEEWPVPELERLAAQMSHTVDQYRNEWDRSKLPVTLLALVEDWEYETRKPLMTSTAPTTQK